MIPNVGEGVYLGSSRRNRRGDVCVGNRIIDNIIGPGVTAEPIDVKEFTRDGVVSGNTLDGRDLCGKCPDPVSLINVKGSGYRIENNRGKNALEYAYKESRVDTAPEPKGNVFKNNTCLTRSRRRGTYRRYRATASGATSIGAAPCFGFRRMPRLSFPPMHPSTLTRSLKHARHSSDRVCVCQAPVARR
jgi:hypothetical protein